MQTGLSELRRSCWQSYLLQRVEAQAAWMLQCWFSWFWRWPWLRHPTTWPPALQRTSSSSPGDLIASSAKKKKGQDKVGRSTFIKKKKNIQQTQITSYISSELKIKTMVQDKGCAISRIFPNLSSAINHKKKTSSKPSLWLYPIWSTCLFLHGQSMVMSIICASL